MYEREKKELAMIVRKDVRFQFPLKKYTTCRVGGNAEAVCHMGDIGRLQDLMLFLKEKKIPYIVIGKGSNLLVKDSGFKGVVIILQEKLAMIEERINNEELILAGGGLSLSKLLDYCKRKGLGGCEFLSGIPGTVGGAVTMNAGAWGKEMGQVVQEIQIVTDKGTLESLGRSHLTFSYRTSSIPKGSVIIKVGIALKREDPEKIQSKISGYLKERREKQPLEYPSCGSTFKNPPEDFAGRLIEEAGLKGKRLGGAMVSEKHANFIVNTGSAKADDFLALMALVKKKVNEQTGITLEPEIEVVG